VALVLICQQQTVLLQGPLQGPLQTSIHIVIGNVILIVMLISKEGSGTISPKHKRILSTAEEPKVVIALAVCILATSADTPIFKLHLETMK
jgi:hypothetical protein